MTHQGVFTTADPSKLASSCDWSKSLSRAGAIVTATSISELRLSILVNVNINRVRITASRELSIIDRGEICTLRGSLLVVLGLVPESEAGLR